MLPSPQEVDRFTTAGQNFVAWLLVGLLMFIALLQALESQWLLSLKCFALAVLVCPLVPIPFWAKPVIALVALYLL